MLTLTLTLGSSWSEEAAHTARNSAIFEILGRCPDFPERRVELTQRRVRDDPASLSKMAWHCQSPQPPGLTYSFSCHKIALTVARDYSKDYQPYKPPVTNVFSCRGQLVPCTPDDGRLVLTWCTT